VSPVSVRNGEEEEKNIPAASSQAQMRTDDAEIHNITNM
jgi:hypothetical protein